LYFKTCFGEPSAGKTLPEKLSDRLELANTERPRQPSDVSRIGVARGALKILLG